jgi:hypothetical protein
MILALAITAILAQDPSVTALEALTNRQDNIEVMLRKHHVTKPIYYAGLINSEIKSPEMRKLFAAKLIVESRGEAKAVSKKGARGPWQVMERWARVYKIHPNRLFEPKTNLRIALKVYNEHLIDAHGNKWEAVRAYSGGSYEYVELIKKLV